MEICVNNRKLGQTSKICVNNRKLGQTSKIWSIIEIFHKNRNYGQK